jgi:hypothetical protein
MKPNNELERFFSAYPPHFRKRAENSSEYQYAIEKGKITTALEIASVIMSDSPDYYEKKRDIQRILKKEFPEISN